MADKNMLQGDGTPTFGSADNLPLYPGATLGVIGGGQLGRMFAHAATQRGYRVVVLDPAETGPAAEVASMHLRYAYDDPEGLEKLASVCDAVTTEFENVPASSLRFLQQRIPVSPKPEAVEVAQNRIREKQFFVDHNLPTNRFERITNAAQITEAWSAMSGKAVIKTTQLGYDGKGQCVCDSADDAQAAFNSFGGVECVLEDFVAFDLEVSVVLARDCTGTVKTFPLAENRHKNGILDVCIVPARVSDTIAENARGIACKLAEALNYVGVLAIEMFVAGDRIVLNEIAPRPHNSGHYTIDATNYSQFDQQVLTLCGLNAVAIELYRPAVMANILGDVLLQENFDWSALDSGGDNHLHMYGKTEARAGRKMGHINFVGDDVDQLLDRVQTLRSG